MADDPTKIPTHPPRSQGMRPRRPWYARFWTIVAAFVVVLVVGAVLLELAVGRLFDGQWGPGEGKDSAHLAVRVSPTTGLRDEATVRVSSEAFEPNQVVGIAQCLREADTERRGVEACDTANGSRFATDAKGRLAQPFSVRRVITVGRTAYDCAAAARRCVLVAASADDFDRSGGRPLIFGSGLPPAPLTPHPDRPTTDHLPITADPSGPSTGPTRVRIRATGFRPGEPLVVARCVDFEEDGPTSCEPLDGSAAIAAVLLGQMDADLPHAAADGSLETTVSTARKITPIDGPVPRCTTAPGRCSIVVAAAADTRRSAVLPYTITEG